MMTPTMPMQPRGTGWRSTGRRRFVLAVTAVTAVTALAPSASAQTPVSPVEPRVAGDAQRAQYQLRVLERVLEQAVEHGAQVVALELQAFAPSSVLFAGSTQARGFALDEYGVFFDVQVPTLRRSITWTFRTLSRNGLALGDALAALRQHVQSLGDVGARDALEQALRSLEVQVGPLPTARAGNCWATSVGSGDRTAVSPSPPPPPADDIDPADVYVAQIRSELANVMLDYSGSLLLAADEWLTVATSGFGGAGSGAAVGAGLMLRVRGRDLAALRSGEISRDEARQRIENVGF